MKKKNEVNLDEIDTALLSALLRTKREEIIPVQSRDHYSLPVKKKEKRKKLN